MSIKLEVWGDIAKEKVILDVIGQTVGDCLDCAIKQQPSLRNEIYDEKGALYPGYYLSFNGKFVFSDLKALSVQDGDQIKIIKAAGC